MKSPLINPSVRKYVDIMNSMQAHPFSKDVVTVADEISIQQSLVNLIMLRTDEKPFHPEIVSGVQQYLFEPMNDVTAKLIEKAIETVVKRYEPRVDLVGAVAIPEEDKNQYDITLVYRLQNSPEPVAVQELNFLMERKR
tara:strand:- start:1000 stop:1416 length:417 start_codon:yes stop_codon:yes gene_type:complete